MVLSEFSSEDERNLDDALSQLSTFSKKQSKTKRTATTSLRSEKHHQQTQSSFIFSRRTSHEDYKPPDLRSLKSTALLPPIDASKGVVRPRTQDDNRISYSFDNKLFDELSARFTEDLRCYKPSEDNITSLRRFGFVRFASGYPVDLFLTELQEKLAVNFVTLSPLTQPNLDSLDTKLQSLLPDIKGMGSSGRTSVLLLDILPISDYSQIKAEVSALLRDFIFHKSRRTPVLLLTYSSIDYYNCVESILPKEVSSLASYASLSANERNTLIAKYIDPTITPKTIITMSKKYLSFIEMFNHMMYNRVTMDSLINSVKEKLNPDNDTVAFRRRYFKKEFTDDTLHEPFNIVPFVGDNMVQLTSQIYFKADLDHSFISELLSQCDRKKYGAETLYFGLKSIEMQPFLIESQEWGEILPKRAFKNRKVCSFPSTQFVTRTKFERGIKYINCLVKEVSAHL